MTMLLLHHLLIVFCLQLLLLQLQMWNTGLCSTSLYPQQCSANPWDLIQWTPQQFLSVADIWAVMVAKRISSRRLCCWKPQSYIPSNAQRRRPDPQPRMWSLIAPISRGVRGLWWCVPGACLLSTTLLQGMRFRVGACCPGKSSWQGNSGAF